MVVTLVAMVFVLVPRGPTRRWVRLGIHLFIAFEVVLGLYLAADFLVPSLYGWILAVAVAQLAFRWLVPEDVFPVTFRRGGNAAHLDLGGERGDAIVSAMRDQLGLVVTEVEPFGLEGSGGSSPLRMTLEDGSRTFGKIYSTSHVRADRWYRIGRTILYGQLEDETPIGSVRRLVILEDYALRFLRDAGVRVARSYGIVELTPNAEYMLVTEFFEHAKTLGDSEVDDVVIDEGMALIRRLWDLGVAHRDIKPANLLVKDGHLQLVDVSGLEIRPSPWRQAVDLANMMLTLALQSDADQVYARAVRIFTPEEIAEGFACAVGSRDPHAAPSAAEGRRTSAAGAVQGAGAVEGTDLDPAVERPADRHHGDRRARRAHAHRVARGLGARRDQLRTSDTQDRRRATDRPVRSAAPSPFVAPSARAPRGHDLRDGRHQEQLSDDRLHHGEGLPRVLARHEVAVAGRRERHETEEQVVADRSVTLRTEERRRLDRADRVVDERERDADAQVRRDRAQHRLAIDRLPASRCDERSRTAR